MRTNLFNKPYFSIIGLLAIVLIAKFLLSCESCIFHLISTINSSQTAPPVDK